MSVDIANQNEEGGKTPTFNYVNKFSCIARNHKTMRQMRRAYPFKAKLYKELPSG